MYNVHTECVCNMYIQYVLPYTVTCIVDMQTWVCMMHANWLRLCLQAVMRAHMQFQKLACRTSRLVSGQITPCHSLSTVLVNACYCQAACAQEACLFAYQLNQHLVDMCWAYMRQGFRACCSSEVSNEVVKACTRCHTHL